MNLALFYEIPGPASVGGGQRAGSRTRTRSSRPSPATRSAGAPSWTVEHHFLQEYSHCSNPEVLYGAIAARTDRIRLGYGVRLMPKPYNHPVRTAESVAVLDLLQKGRVDLGAGQSATRAELGTSGSIPPRAVGMWRGPSATWLGVLDQRRVRVRRRVLADEPPPGAAQAVAEAAPAAVGRHHQ